MLSYKSKLLIYNGLVKPHTEYCALAWMDKLNKQQMEVLTKLQKRAIRLVFNASYNTHTAQLFSISKVTPIELIYKKEALKFLKMFNLDEQPKAFYEIFDKCNDGTDMRSHKKFTFRIPPKFKNGQAFYNMLKTWNSSEIIFRKPCSVKEYIKTFKEQTTITLDNKKCTSRNCFMCTRDLNRDFKKYAGVI